MADKVVVSREYKVMLLVKPFAGSEAKVKAAAHDLWQDFSKAISGIVLETEGDLDTIKTRRVIRFFDTSEKLLKANDYIFRDRSGIDDGSRQVTLKFRHPDRFLSQSRDMTPAPAADAKTKFEEDIKAPFVSLYSFSTTVKTDAAARFKTLKDVAALVPDVRERVEPFPENAEIAAVGTRAREVVIEGSEFQIGKTPKVNAECGLIVWYDEDASHEKPVVVELSFRYGDKEGNYGGGLSRRAYDVFKVLQSERMKAWVDPAPKTKTEFIFG